MPLSLDGLALLELSLGGEPAYVPRRLPGGKTTWSHSSQSLAERCPALWKRRYLDRVADPPTSALAAGSAFGAALQHVYGAALLERNVSAEEAAELAAATFDERAAEGLIDAARAPAARERAIEASRAHARERAPVTLRSLGESLRAVERRFQLRLAGVDQAGRPAVCEWPISGYLDLDSDREVRDFKLVGRSHPTQAEADRSLQGGLYLLARAAEGDPAERFVLDSTRREHGPRSRTPRFAEVRTTRSEAALVALQRRVAAAALSVALAAQVGSWPYAATLAWWCAHGQCPAWARCPGGGLAAGSAPTARASNAEIADAGRAAA